MGYSDFQRALLQSNPTIRSASNENIRVSTSNDLYELSKSKGAKSDATAARWISLAITSGILVKIRNGLYLNYASGAAFHEIAPFFHRQAIVSSKTVLGENGVINPVYSLHLISPKSPTKLNRSNKIEIQNSNTTIFWHQVKEDIFEVLLNDAQYIKTGLPRRDAYLQSSIEGALSAMIYLEKNCKKSKETWRFNEYDMEYIDQEKLKSIGKKMDINHEIDDFLKMDCRSASEEYDDLGFCP